jgi:hypothetical protein
MPEVVLKAPNYFDREFDLTERVTPVGGIPATVVGGANRGPAFVPVSLGSYDDFQAKFGSLDPKFVGGYGVQKFLEAKGSEVASVNYIRVLGCGANSSSADISDTEQFGTVVNAGMKVVGNGAAFTSGALQGRVQFLVGTHAVQTNEAFGYPMFTDNASYASDGIAPDSVNLVRAVLFTTPDARFIVGSGSTAATYDPTTITAGTNNYEAAFVGTEGALVNKFKLILSSSTGGNFASDDGLPGLKIFSASLDPTDTQYIGKLLNTNPENFETAKHLLYLEYPVDAEVAALSSSQASSLTPTVAILSGSSNVAVSGLGLTYGQAFGWFNTRYKAPKTPYFISQPFGNIEYDLFYAESLDDGDYANNKYKISIVNLQASTNPSQLYGSFTLQVRAWADSDAEPQILEVFNNLSLDPDSDNYVIKAIGDKKTTFNFDGLESSDRTVTVSGKYGNRSKYIRVVPSSQLNSGEVPEKAFPFGFRGHQALLTSPLLADNGVLPPTSAIITGVSSSTAINGALLSGSIVPPVPFRFTVTRNNLATSGVKGAAGTQTVLDSRLYWGVKFERNNGNVLNVNVNEQVNEIVENYAKFSGIEKLNVLATGSASDTINNNKFTLAKVALPAKTIAEVEGSAVTTQMKSAAYIRDASLNINTYQITSSVTADNDRITLASLANSSNAILFNNFSPYTKFTTFMQGGWNGTNIFDKNASRFTDRSTSTEEGPNHTYGLANASYVSPGSPVGVNYTGAGLSNSNVVAYKTAINIATNVSIANNNILILPGQRDPLVTNYALEKNLEYGLSFYLMDIQPYDQNSARIWDGDLNRFVSIAKTTNTFVARAVDNNAAAAYFPNVVADDTVNNRRITLPASIAALSALSYNDRVKFPWFAPAGFDRGSLSWVILSQIRINQSDRNSLFDANINPIVKFPGANYVFFSQNTLQQAVSALESINVKRMVLEVKRQMVIIGNRILFEQNTPATRSRFVNEATLILAAVQLQQGIEKFKVVCDTSNNTAEDVNSNRMNAQIRVLPTRAVEYIVMDFVILPSGVTL